MTPQALGAYRRARAAGIPARSAIALARTLERPDALDWHGDAVTFESEGFAIEATARPDEYGFDLSDMGYGRFIAGTEDWRTGHDRRPDPDAIPDRGSAFSTSNQWYLPAYTLVERARDHRAAGASRGVAWDLAREGVATELRAAHGGGYGPDVRCLTVTASRAGVTLARDTLGGIELAWDPITRTDGSAYLDECVRDMLPDVIEQARATLAALGVPA